MGNEVSVSIAPTPLPLSDVFINGELDLLRCYMCKRKGLIKEFQNYSLNHLILKRENCKVDQIRPFFCKEEISYAR